MNTSQKIAKAISQFSIFNQYHSLWQKNQTDINLNLHKFEKIMVGIYLILTDYSNGLFPPTFNDQQKAYQAEINYRFFLPNVSALQAQESGMRKPFAFGKHGLNYLDSFAFFVKSLEKLGVDPPSKLLELGCGTGWMSEFLAIMGFDVVGTSISPYDIEDSKTRIKSLEIKGINANLQFLTSPMESVSNVVGEQLFDSIFIFEALHHAYDWREAITSSYNCLKHGGWLIICNEPNVIHTCVSYRIARLSNTHEVGFKRSDLINHLKLTKFTDIKILKNRNDYFIQPHWIAARKQ